MRSIYGERASATARDLFVAKLERMAGRRGLAARTGPAQYAVLLPRASRDDATDAAYRELGRPCRIEPDLGREEMVLVPEVLVAVCKPGHGTLERLYVDMSVTLARRRHAEERRRTRLRQERDRQSRAMALSQSVRDSRPSSIAAD
jgi:GGDEF domain-containing protein